MNKFLCVILLSTCLWPGHLWAQFHIDNLVLKPDVKKHGLKGQVWKITQMQSPVSNKEGDLLDGFSGQNYQEEYNRQGYIQKQVYCDDFNKPRTATYYEYDANGRETVLRIESLAPDQFGSHSDGRIDYEYNDAKNSFIIHDNRTIIGKRLRRHTEVVRDTINRTLMTREHQQDTVLTQEQHYWWDKYGYVTKQISRIRNQPSTDIEFKKEDLKALMGPLSGQEERALDSLMRREDSLKIQQSKNQSAWLTDTTIYQNKYDQQGRLIYQASYRNNKQTGGSRFTYSPNTAVIYESYNRAGELTSETASLRHPIKGYILPDSSRSKNDGKRETSAYNSADYPKSTYRYQYDSQGNWIEKKQVDANGKQMGVALVRKIEYYL